MRRVKVAGVLVASVLLVGACSKSDDKETTDTTTAETTETTTASTGSTATSDTVNLEGSTEGISDTEINIAYVNGDTAALQEAGIVPVTGDPWQQFQVFVDLANEAGGAGGLQIKASNFQYAAGAPATDQQPACIGATEDSNAAIVVYLGGFAPETILCTTESHERIAYGLSGIMLQEVYDASAGRFFSQGISSERLMQAWVDLADAQGLLEGHTLGIIRADLADHEATAAALVSALEAAGYEVTENIALPCEGRSCSQNDVAAQRMQSSGIDTVFSLLSAIPYPTFVQAAVDLGFEPQWLSSDFENQVFNSTAKFMESVAASYDGAIGATYGIDAPTADDYGTECNAKFTAVTGITYEYGTEGDAWLAVRTACHAVEVLVQAINKALDEYGVVNQTTIVLAMQTLDPSFGPNEGSWSDTKHDSADVVTLEQWHSDCLCWLEVEGTRTTLS